MEIEAEMMSESENKQSTVSVDPLTFKNLDFLTEWLNRPKSKIISELIAVIAQKTSEFRKGEVVYFLDTKSDLVTIRFLGRKSFSKSGVVPDVPVSSEDPEINERGEIKQ